MEGVQETALAFLNGRLADPKASAMLVESSYELSASAAHKVAMGKHLEPGVEERQKV